MGSLRVRRRRCDEFLFKNHQDLTPEMIITVIEKYTRSSTLYYVDCVHDGIIYQYDMDLSIKADEAMLNTVTLGITIHTAKEAVSSSLYIAEMVFYTNVIYGFDAYNPTDLFNNYFDNFTACGHSGEDINHFFKDYGT